MSYLTDEEKAEAIKKWWSDNWTAVAGGIVLGIVGLFSWNWWTDRQETRGELASDQYILMLSQVNEGQWAQATLTGQQLLESGSRTPYTAMAWALLADIATREGDSEAALDALFAARKEARDSGFHEILTLRLARHLVAANRIAEATNLLEESTSPAFAGLRSEIQGDIARVEGRIAAAREAYSMALSLGHDTEYLRLKLDELSE